MTYGGDEMWERWALIFGRLVIVLGLWDERHT